MKSILLLLAIFVIASARYNIVHSKSTLPASAQPLTPPTGRDQLLHTQQEMTDNQIIQAYLQGFFAQNDMPGPFMVKYCFDDELSHQFVTYMGDLFAKAAKASLTGLIQLVQQTEQFGKSLSFPFILCLGKCQQIVSLGHKYDVDVSTDFEGLVKKIIEYITLHYLESHKWAVDLNDKWENKHYFQAGYNSAIYAHKIQYGSR